MSKADTIEAFLRGAVGCGYVYGATGWVCSQARREQQARQYPQYEATILGTCAKWDGTICYDCAQLVKKAAALVGYSLPSGATSQWRWTGWSAKGEIGTAPTNRLLCLLRDDGTGVKQHIGWRLRNGDVIDARGSSAGVVLNLKYTAWTHWAELPGMYDEDEEAKNVTVLYQAMVATQSDPLSIREGHSADTRKVGSAPKGAIVDVINDTGDWWEIVYGGIEGCVSKKYMARIGEELPPIRVETEQNVPDIYVGGIGKTTLAREDGVRIALDGRWRIVSD